MGNRSRVGRGSERRGLSGSLATTDVAIDHYRIAPHDGLPDGLHAHADQEEVFVVLEGEATFETLAGEVDVRAGEAIRFAPGEFQPGTNDADEALPIVAMGAPRRTDDVRIPVRCPECDHDDLRLDAGDDGTVFACPGCRAERVPRPCTDCGSENLRVALGETVRTVVVCRNCGDEFEVPPVRGRW